MTNKGFETGDLTEFSSAVTDGGNLSAQVAAALHGSYGLNCLINDTNEIYVQDDTPNNETRHRGRFYVDPNTLTITNGQVISLAKGLIITPSGAFGVYLKFLTATGYYISAWSRKDDGSFLYTSDYAITDAVHWVEVDWKASSAALANNGFTSLWIDTLTAPKETLSNIDNDTRVIDLTRLGPQNIAASTSGTIYLDDYDWNNTGSAIGGVTYQATHTGLLVPEGALNKKIYQIPAGLIIPSGALIKKPAQILIGSQTNTGILVKKVSQTNSGDITPSGVLNKKVSQTHIGAVTFTGTLIQKIKQILAGSISFIGEHFRTITSIIYYAVHEGAITFSGNLTKKVYQIHTGIFIATGELKKTVRQILTGVITFAGTFEGYRIKVIEYIAKLFNRSLTTKLPNRSLTVKLNNRNLTLKMRVK